MRKKGRLSVVDLFAGAGLLSCAFASERFNLVRAIEQNKIAAESYRSNVGDHVEIADIRDVKPEGRCDVLIGGPPCQGFSTLGRRDKNDPRNRLTTQMADWAEVLKPNVVVVENVPTFLTSHYWANLQNRFEELGYEVSSVVLNAADFGVAQVRRRCFVFASKIGLPTIAARKQRHYTTVREAWEGLAKKPDGTNGHYAPAPSALTLARMKVIPPGGDKRDVLRLAPDLAPPSWSTRSAAKRPMFGDECSGTSQATRCERRC